ncbi:hypothetical protein AAHE18_17G241500 [Arachis hypogaea]
MLTFNIIILSLKIVGLNCSAQVKNREYSLNVAKSKSKTKQDSYACRLQYNHYHTEELSSRDLWQPKLYKI